MRTCFAIGFLAVLPAAASATVTVRVDPGTYTWNGQDQVVSWEVYAEDTGPVENERLNAFTVQLDMPEWTPNGIRFLIPPPDHRGWTPFQQTTEHPYVFAGFPDSDPFDPSGGSDYNTLRLAGVIWEPNQAVDIGPARSGLGKVDVFVPANSPFWGTMVFSPVFTSMAGPDGEIPVVTQSATWVVIPEPASLGVLALGATLVVRRRTRTAA